MHNRLQTAKSIDEVQVCINLLELMYSRYPISSNCFILLMHVLHFNMEVFHLSFQSVHSSIYLTMFFMQQVIQYHDLFLDKCLRECLLLLPELLKVHFHFHHLIFNFPKLVGPFKVNHWISNEYGCWEVNQERERE